MKVAANSIVSLLSDEENLSPEECEIFSGEIKESLENFVPKLDMYSSYPKRSSSVELSLQYLIPFVNLEESMFSYMPSLCSYHSFKFNESNNTTIQLSPKVVELINSYQKKQGIKKANGGIQTSVNNTGGNVYNITTNNVLTELCKDQQGSRKIQQFFETATKDEINQIFKCIYSDSLDLMVDLFGNYVIQKLLEYGTSQHIQLLFDTMKGNIVRLSLHMYGCRVVQKIFEVLPIQEIRSISNEIRSNVSNFIEDQNGNHVIQKFIDFAGDDDLMFIVDEIFYKVIDYSKHPYGCRVIQRLIEKNTQCGIDKITNKLVEYVWDLSINQYGNYVIQHLIQHGTNNQRIEIVKNIKGKLYDYSMKKYSSNVVEKCIRCCEEPERDILVNELCNDNVSNRQINEMMCDPYANYVIQRLVEMMNEEQKAHFINIFINPNIESLRRNTHAKHLIQRINSSTI